MLYWYRNGLATEPEKGSFGKCQPGMGKGSVDLKNIRIAAAQFEGKDGDKDHNLDLMQSLVQKAVDRGAEVVSFHEICISGYTFMRHFSRDELLRFAEPVPDGPSVQKLMAMSRRHQVAILAGLLEVDGEHLYNTYVCVDGSKLVSRHRKIHAFLNPYISSGAQFSTFELRGWTCSSLICYDNNIAENVREVTLMGADIVFMPHVTCCLDWGIPGSGSVDQRLWDNRQEDPVSVRLEFMGLKAREWLLKWVPSRAYDNGVYVVFTNPIGVDDDQIRNGNAMVLDPYGDIIAECNTLGNDVVVGLCTPEKIDNSLGRTFIAARKPHLYQKLVETPESAPVIDPRWDTNA